MRAAANRRDSDLIARVIRASRQLLHNPLCARTVAGKVLDRNDGLTRVVIHFEQHEATAFFHISDKEGVIAYARDEKHELWRTVSLQEAVAKLESESQEKVQARGRFWQEVAARNTVPHYPNILSEREDYFLRQFIDLLKSSINLYELPELVYHEGEEPYVSLSCVSLNSHQSHGDETEASVLVLIDIRRTEDRYTFKGRGGMPISVSTLPELATLLRSMGAK